MTNTPLQQFAQQLASWTEAIIEHGRTPFRRVDTYPTINTDVGVIQPPIVFWINRQSMMAGGVLLLPDNNLEAELLRGRNCASALGLSHFITWETDQVRIWQCNSETTTEHKVFPLLHPNQPETFHFLLDDLLEALKLLAVIGATPAHKLPSCYFNNLFHITLQQTLPPLVAAYRSQRSEIDSPSPENADTCANEANRLALLRLLVTSQLKVLPLTILPEDLEQTIKTALKQLPMTLQQSLTRTTVIKPPQLPSETAVCFHHLFLRLQQLAWNQTTTRSTATIRDLIDTWYPNTTDFERTEEIKFYPETPRLHAATEIILSGSAIFLAATAILNSDQQRCQLFHGKLFQLERSSIPQKPVYARLLNNNGISNMQRHEFSARLRTAWPNRRLKIKTGQPFWRWELIHLLGICHPKQKLTLELPAGLLQDAGNQTAWTLICEQLNFQHIELLSNGNINFKLECNNRSNYKLPIQLPTDIREIEPIDEHAYFRSQLLLALKLPSDIHKLIGNELIWYPTTPLDSDQLVGLEKYRQSNLYQYLLEILKYNKSTSKESSQLPTTGDDIPIPHPEPLLLNELAKTDHTLTTTSSDDFLAILLNCPAVAALTMVTKIETKKLTAATIQQNKKLKEDIVNQLLTHGVPNFPEQYLYFLDSPEIIHYSILPPLKVNSSLMGQFELEDANGKTINGYGEELEQILLFCSRLEKTLFDLPADRVQLQQLLNLYRKDLKALYKHLNDLCYSQLQDSKAAQKLIKKIWSTLNLPTPSWVNL